MSSSFFFFIVALSFSIYFNVFSLVYKSAWVFSSWELFSWIYWSFEVILVFRSLISDIYLTISSVSVLISTFYSSICFVKFAWAVSIAALFYSNYFFSPNTLSSSAFVVAKLASSYAFAADESFLSFSSSYLTFSSSVLDAAKLLSDVVFSAN